MFAKSSFPVWLFIFAAFSVLAGVSYQRVVPAEDAVILYEYARNLARRGIITYGNAAVPIEGATDFLWMLLIAGLKRGGIEEFASALLLNTGAALGILYLCYRHSERNLVTLVVCAAAVFLTPYVYSSAVGFSTIFFSFLFVLVLSTVRASNAYLFYLLAFLFCLTRPDGLVWIIGPICVRFYRRTRTHLKSEVKAGIIGLMIPGGAYFAWRVSYFGELLPLPFLVKSSGSRELLVFVSDSIRAALPVFIPILVGALLSSDRRRAVSLASVTFVVPFCFYGSMQLEQNIGNRFFGPAFFGALWYLSGQRKLALLGFIAVSVALNLRTAYYTFEFAKSSMDDNTFYLAKDLSQVFGKMSVTEAGHLTYYSGWHAHDSWGLNTPAYAKRLIQVSDFERERYDLINAHCDLALLLQWTPNQLEQVPARSWDNQCRVIAKYLANGDYEIFMVPFWMSDIQLIGIAAASSRSTRQCFRHDVYALRRSSPLFEPVKAILLNRGAKTRDDLSASHFSVRKDKVCVEAKPAS